LARRLLDLPRLKRLMAQWPKDENEAEKRMSEYRLALARGVHVGRFIRWVEGGNAWGLVSTPRAVEQFPLFRTNSIVIPLFRRQRFDPRCIEIAKETSRPTGPDLAKFAVNSVVS
jgi:hypothetical protein